MKKADIGVGVGLIGLSVWVFWKSHTYRQAAIYIYGPNFFPQIVSVLTIICALVLITQALLGKSLAYADRIDGRGFVRTIIAIALSIGYLLLMQIIGFAMATCVFLFVLMAFLKQKGMTRRILSSISVSLIVWVIFRYFLVIPIPTGIFEFTF